MTKEQKRRGPRCSTRFDAWFLQDSEKSNPQFPMEPWQASLLRAGVKTDHKSIQGVLRAGLGAWSLFEVSDEEVEGMLVDGLSYYRLSSDRVSVPASESGHFKRQGILVALEAAIHSLMNSDRVRNPDHLIPLAHLHRALIDLESGVVDPALEPDGSGGNRHPSERIDFKARCLLASELLQSRGKSKEVADAYVKAKVKRASERLGIRWNGGNGRANGKGGPFEIWRRQLRREEQAKQMDALSERIWELELAMKNRSPDGVEPAAADIDQILGPFID
jgi:hypothetical protein